MTSEEQTLHGSVLVAFTEEGRHQISITVSDLRKTDADEAFITTFFREDAPFWAYYTVGCQTEEEACELAWHFGRMLNVHEIELTRHDGHHNGYGACRVEMLGPHHRRAWRPSRPEKSEGGVTA